MTRNTARQLSLGSAAALGLLMLAGPALADERSPAAECGDTITRHARLDRDLVCATAAKPALTVNGGTLDLGGFTVVCDQENSETSVGILLEGRGARLRDGAVTGCALAISVADLGDHVIRNVTASASNQGVLIASDRNRLVNSHILRGFNDAAVQVDGHNNHLSSNDIVGSEDQGFEVNGNDNRIVGNRIGGVAEGVQLSGEGNQVLRNQIIGATDRGVEVRAGAHVIAFNLIADGGADGIALLDAGNGNHVHRNSVYSNADEGIEVATENNRIERNRVLLNGLDLQDTTPNCDNNLWQDNVFETSDPDDCID
jgi:parallel beta-helix repeat protein